VSSPAPQALPSVEGRNHNTLELSDSPQNPPSLLQLAALEYFMPVYGDAAAGSVSILILDSTTSA